MMSFMRIDNGLYISGQIREEDIPAIKSSGIRSVICHRPDNEENGQPDFAELAAKIRAAGIEHTYHQPIVSEQLNEEQSHILNHILHEADFPVLMFCRTGTRSMLLWSMLQAMQGISPAALLKRAQQAGIDLSCMSMKLKDIRRRYAPVVAIDVDAQRTFSPLCPNELPVADGDKIVAELNKQAKLADFRVMTKDAHSASAIWAAQSPEQVLQPLNNKEKINADVYWPRHAEVGSEGFELLPGLPAADKYDFLVYKGVEKDMHPYGACFHDLHDKISTGLIEWLNYIHAKTIIVGGLATDYCVKNTVLQLCRNGDRKVMVNLAACRGIADDTVAQAIAQMKDAGAIIVSDADEIENLIL